MPILISLFIDRVVGEGHWEWLGFIFSAMLMVFVLQGVVSFFNTYIISSIAQRIIFDIRRGLYQKILSLSIPFFDRMKTGTLISRMMDDVNIVQRVITTSTISIFTDILTLTVVIIVLLFMNWKLTFILLAFLPFYGTNFSFFVKHIHSVSLKARNKMDEIISNLHERISGVLAVKSFNREQFETREFVIDSRESLDFNMECNFLGVSLSAVASTISGIGTSLILCLAGLWVIKEDMTIGKMMMFASLSGYLFGPSARLTELSNILEQARVSMERLIEILDADINVKEKPQAHVIPKIKGEVIFDRVAFHYTSDRPVLHNFNLTVKPGEMVALVGPTGCGKTTIVNLILRFYDPTSGRILIDGHNLTDITFSSLRSQIGIVPQEPVIFHMSILDNILYGNLSATFEEVEKSAQAAELDTFIKSLPKKYEEITGEGGLKLSMGERQRLTIARAILSNPSIIILDEATSSLDSESEMLIQKALLILMKGRTSFVIAHRLSTIINADKIIVMEKGHIVEQGTHKELMMKSDSRYQKFYYQQLGMEEKEKIISG